MMKTYYADMGIDNVDPHVMILVGDRSAKRTPAEDQRCRSYIDRCTEGVAVVNNARTGKRQFALYDPTRYTERRARYLVCEDPGSYLVVETTKSGVDVPLRYIGVIPFDYEQFYDGM